MAAGLHCTLLHHCAAALHALPVNLTVALTALCLTSLMRCDCLSPRQSVLLALTVFLAMPAWGALRPRGCLRMQRCVQAALTRDIQETMRAWRQQLQECALVFVHAPAANAGPLFHGEAPPLSRGDRRVRSVPFTTRRPTFSETKRVAQLLLTASAAEAPQAAAPPPAGAPSAAATANVAHD